MSRLRTALVVLVAVAVAGVGVRSLSNATMSTHEPVARGSRIELVLDARTKKASAGQDLTELVTAQILACRLEVSSDLVGAVEAVDVAGDHTRYQVLLTPSMDRTDRRQFHGCLEDWVIDHVRLDVVSLVPR